MKKHNGASQASASTAARKSPRGLIHPVIIYPFQEPADHHDLEELYQLAQRLAADPSRFAKPLTVMDRKTFYRTKWDKRFMEFREQQVAAHSTILDAWCVDTCQMWYTALGAAFESGKEGDIYWLIPGDFNYGSPVGREVLSHLHDLPEIIDELDQDLCVGEVAREATGSKRLIDIYGTFALLLNWFPDEALDIYRLCQRPRSEFLAIRHGFLAEVLNQRWYAYEQTLVILLHALFGKKKVSRFSLGEISDLPTGRDTLASAIQQIERLERVLKMVWRERHEKDADWFPRYQELERQSERICSTAHILLAPVLK